MRLLASGSGRAVLSSRSARLRVVALVALAGVAALVAPAAEASFHIMSIREVYAGSVARPDSQYVMLQMRAGGQSFVGGHSVDVYDAAGTPTGHFTFAGSVSNGAGQSFILVATQAAANQFGLTPDLLMTPVLNRRGGRVCFDSFDCFAWGNYTGPANRCDQLGSSNLCITGTPFRASEGLASGRAARRDISLGDPNLLEPPNNEVSPTGAAGDDRGDSSLDFFYSPDPKPTTNGGEFPAPPPIGTGIDLVDFTSIAALVRSRNGPVADGGVLRLTPLESAPARSSVWHRLRQPVTGGLETLFTFRITPNGGTDSEGFAFVIQNESNSSLGGGGGKLGYQGITNGVAVEFDTRRSGGAEIGTGDPAGTPPNRIGIHSLGTAANSAGENASLAISDPVAGLDDGNIHTARILYAPGAPGTLSVFLDGTLVTQASVNLATLLDITRGAAFVGFTSGSGSGLGDNDILSWKLAEDLPPQPPVVHIEGGIVVNESRANVTFSVVLDRPHGKDVVVGLATAGTATRGEDYRFAGTSVKIPAGETTVTRELFAGQRDIIDDAVDEPNETVIIRLDPATSLLRGATIGTPASTRFTIKDDDAATN